MKSTVTEAPYRTLILNATLVNEGRAWVADMLLQNNRIARIAADLQALPADLVIDARGLHLLPGMIDDQVHFREPGLTHKGSIATESAAAVAGASPVLWTCQMCSRRPWIDRR